MRDIGHEETDELIRQLEKKLNVEYAQATQEVAQKLREYFQSVTEKDRIWHQQLASGEITQKEYNNWRKGQIMMGKRWEELKETLAQDWSNTNAIARSIIEGYTREAYALNHNYATFTVERGSNINTSYTLYNRHTVEHLMRDNPKILPLPGKRIDDLATQQKIIRWQEGQIQSVTLQAILQGESIPHMAKRIAQTLGEYNHADSVRYARTAMTAAQNAGRHDAYERAESKGIKMRQTWVATLDDRTRDAHRELDGQTVDIDEPFTVDGFELRYPGDPDGEPYLIWNCRCTTIVQIKGFERDVSDLNIRNTDHLGNMTYDEWKAARSK